MRVCIQWKSKEDRNRGREGEKERRNEANGIKEMKLEKRSIGVKGR